MPAPREHPDGLRERAVREVRATGRPIAHVAKDLGTHKEALRGRVRRAGADAGEHDDRLTTAERDELKRLREESAELKRANEILKAARVFLPRRPTVPGRGRASDRPPARTRPRDRSPPRGGTPSLPGAGVVAASRRPARSRAVCSAGACSGSSRVVINR
ncbi:transposase [Streptomyces roseirectus]|uniref:Transposase n=1 Tax=Streptomyces roseirectus TaxID=2768066 RepID=A0A7H0IQQ7_9ACTN|nr:transposase [Streptomyces roseirectus]QNP75123.1 transposase [Streptomyces roseirectus]